MDTRTIVGGVLWQEELVEAIEGSRLVVLALSPNAVQSENIRKELDLADSSGKPIIPIMIEKVEIPASIKYQLAGIQPIDMSKDMSGGLQKLLYAIVDLIKDESRRTLQAIPAGKAKTTAITPKYPSTDEIFNWRGHELLVRTELKPKYLWMATDTALFLDGVRILVIGGMHTRVKGHSVLNVNGKEHLFDLTARTGNDMGQDYSVSVDGVEIKSGLVFIRNKYMSYVRTIVFLLLIMWLFLQGIKYLLSNPTVNMFIEYLFWH